MIDQTGTDGIVEAIGAYLKELFPDWRVYIQNTAQNIEEPCLIVERASGRQRERLGERVLFDELYSVAVLCPGDIHQLRGAVERAELMLRFIPVKGERPIMTRDRQSQIVDDTQGSVTFWVTRTVWFKPDDPPLQMTLRHTTGVAKDMSKIQKTKASDYAGNDRKYPGGVLAGSRMLSGDKWLAEVALDPEREYTIPEAIAAIEAERNRKV